MTQRTFGLLAGLLVLISPAAALAAPSYAGSRFAGFYNGESYWEIYYTPDFGYSCLDSSIVGGEIVGFTGAIPFESGVHQTYSGSAGFNHFYCQVNVAAPRGTGAPALYFTWLRKVCGQPTLSCSENGVLTVNGLTF